jgi:hypothetical protein
MLPLVYVAMSYGVITLLGLIVLALLPGFRLTVLNLLFFDLGAIPGGIAFLYACGMLFENRRLHARAAKGFRTSENGSQGGRKARSPLSLSR